MASPLATIVAIDDDAQNLELIQEAIGDFPVEILCCSTAEHGLETVLKTRPDIVLLDLVMPGRNGMELLEIMAEKHPAADVVLMTGHYSTESAVEAIQKGACDYLTKPISIADLRQRVDKLVSEATRRQKAVRLEKELLGANRFDTMVGRSPEMLEVFARIRRVAPHFRTALISGATGTGKELAAQALHRMSPVASAPFVVLNCSAVVETLFESELFGYVKGAFTGAAGDRVGLFEHANGGTLFLDELGDMPFSMQSKLLRALQNQEVRRVGSAVVSKVNVRVIAATNRDLTKMIAKGTFREDLYYRLSMLQIKLPPLVERREDLSLLIRHFLDHFGEQYNKSFRGLTARAQALLTRHSWPGNIRELENALGSACMMADGPMIDVRDLPEQLRAPRSHEGDELRGPILSLIELERRYARDTLKRLGGNKVKTAEALGISRATLYRLLDDEVEREEGTPASQVKD